MRYLRQAVDRNKGGRFTVEGVSGAFDGWQSATSGVTVATTDRNPRPLKVTRRDDDLGCDVRRVVGYVGKCPECDENMPMCSTLHLARLALEMHQLHRHGT